MRIANAALLMIVLWASCPPGNCRAEECSAAVIRGQASIDGRPILWKNRDTDHLLNKVVFVSETPHPYLGVVDADDASGRRIYVGLNAAGFAIMNTVAYNLPKKSGEAEDLEGTIMADALRLCATADDFERYIRENLGRGLGSQANFGVIDSSGAAVAFEVYNHGYRRIDADSLSEKYILITNFSRSGEVDKGRGYVRFDRLSDLFRADEDGKYSCAQILQVFSRDMQNPYLVPFDPALWPGLTPERAYYIYTQQTIDRGSTASATVIHGVGSGQDPRDATMWVILGEPVCGIAVPLWVEAGEVPPELERGDKAPINRESMRLKSLLRPFKDSERAEYADVTKLDNDAGSGWLPAVLGKEREIIERTEAFLATGPDGEAKAKFQRQIAADVFKALEEIK
jgi:hypothetical protein